MLNILFMKALNLLFIAFLLTFQSCAQEPAKKTETTNPDYSNVDYSAKSNIIDPDTLRGDQRKIFYHPYFLKLTSKETRNLDPFKVQEEFEKLGIVKEERARFVSSYSYFLTYYLGHKKSCEQWESFKDLAPNSD